MIAVRSTNVVVVVGLALILGGCASMKPLPPGEALTVQERKDAIRRASVWSPTRIKTTDFKKGPKIEGGFDFNEWVNCDYKEKKMNGHSPKFACETKSGEEIKVKYGPRNAEIYGEVMSTRLFWGLGFAADTMFPVRVRCKGCPPDPKRHPKAVAGIQEFDPAAIEQKLPGRAMETTEDSGWKWPELDDLGPESPPNARTHRDALKLLAAFVQHSDNKPANQRLICPEGQEIGKHGCRAPVMMIHDLGLTFGEASLLNLNKHSVRLAAWSEVPVWKDPNKCVASLKGWFPGRFNDPTISEAGRGFLAGLLSELSDAQLRDLFETARVSRRSADPSGDPRKDAPPASVEEWVNVFQLKRSQIVDHRCPR